MSSNRHELERHLTKIPGVKEVLEVRENSPLPPEAPLFSHLTYSAARKFNSEWLHLTEAEFDEFFERALYFTESLTSTQSIAQLQQRKQNLSKAISRTGYFSSIEPQQSEWYRRLSQILGLFPDIELDALSSGADPLSVWQRYEVLESLEDRSPEDKIISFEQAVCLAIQAREENRRVGLNIGKYRLGHGHQDYAENLRTAKHFLGKEGLLLVGLQSAASIESQATEEDNPEIRFTLPDFERLFQVAELPADYVFLADPTFGGSIDMSGVDLKQYFFQIWLRIWPRFYFMGYANHELRPIFEKYASQLGVFLLYQEEEERISTTEIIHQIQQAVKS